MKISVLLLWFVSAAGALAVEWKTPPNPLALPVPGGKAMDFIPVFLGTDNPLLGTVEFTSGTPGTTPEETPTISTVGGTFRTDAAAGVDWFYYLGATEVSRGVYNAVLKEAGFPEKGFPEGEDDLPVTGVSWFEVQEFLRLYNLWLLSQEKKLPLPEGVLVFVRLPTEAEWEFAARGGSLVSRSQFDQTTPYGDEEVTLHEWVAGPASSHHKLNPIRRLQPNPLGFYDMLGNAAEMTTSVFQLEPGQGAVGGIVQRGGNFRTRAEDLRSSIRGEFSLFDAEGREAVSPSLGFRLAVGTILYSDIARVQEIRSGWETYRATRIIPRPGSTRMEPSSEIISRETTRAVETAMGRESDTVARLEDQLRDLSAERLRYETRTVETLVRWLSQNAHILGKNSYLLSQLSVEEIADPLDRQLDILRQDPEMPDRHETFIDLLGKTLKNFATNRVENLQVERRHAGEVYLEALQLLAELSPEKVRVAFEAHTAKLLQESDGVSQAATTQTAYQQLAEYAQNRKVAFARWQDELAQAYQNSP